MTPDSAVRLRTPPRAPRPPARRRDRRLWWALAGGWLAHLALRLWLFRYHAYPVANPDETGYLVAARWLAGGPGADFSGSTFYQGGYALLLTPLHWFTTDPEAVYRLAVGVGSALSATAFPLAYLVLRRLDTGRRAALALSFAVGLSPSLLLFSGLALADAVLPTLLLGWLLAVHDLARHGSVRAGAAAGALGAYAMAVHMRGVVVLAVTVVAAVAMLALRRVPRRAGLAALGAAGAGAAGGAALNRAVAAAIYPGGARDLAGILLSRVTSAEGQAWALSGAAGQLWYLIVGTWGLAGIGVTAAAVVAVRGRGLMRGQPGHDAAGFARRVAAVALLLTTLGIAYASSAALPDEHRVGNYAYGRYLACVAVAWTLVGLAVLVRARRAAVLGHAAAAAALAVAAGGVAAGYAGDRLQRYAFIAFDFPEVIFLSGVPGSFDMAGASATALALLAALTAAALLRGPALVRGPALFRGSALLRMLPATLLVLAAVNAAFVVHLAPDRAPVAGPDRLPRPPAGRVAVDLRVTWPVRHAVALRVTWTRLETYDGARRDPPSGACTAVVPPDAGPPPPGWTAIGDGDAAKGWTTWSGPGCRP